ncbi:enoyl-CoA hydratase-related protein [Maricurvus nonylphenolicus]|uniref:enoyl-CoA hydratase/isomerase family protein n=1 Tax=Maricurvus nonylphenolicus TaxID=1008307 RepID=UPI0036F36379
MNTFEFIDVSVNNHIATITINRADKKNAFNNQTMEEFGAAIDAVNSNDDVRVVTIAAAGDIFCSGIDINGSIDVTSAQTTPENIWKPIILSISQAPKLYIAAVQGPAIGFGTAIMLACDMVIMSDKAFMQLPFVNFGWVPDCGVNWELTRQLGVKRAIEFVTGAEKYSAERCVEFGLANKAVAAEDFDSTVAKLTQKLAAQAPLALKEAKRIIRLSQHIELPESISLEAETQQKLFQTADAMEAMTAFMQKRKPVFTGK